MPPPGVSVRALERIAPGWVPFRKLWGCPKSASPPAMGLWFVKLSSPDSQEVLKNERLWCRALHIVLIFVLCFDLRHKLTFQARTSDLYFTYYSNYCLSLPPRHSRTLHRMKTHIKSLVPFGESATTEDSLVRVSDTIGGGNGRRQTTPCLASPSTLELSLTS